MTKDQVKKVLYVVVPVLFIAVIIFTVLASKRSGENGLSTASFITISEMAVMAILSCYYVLVGCNKEDGSAFFKLYMFVFGLFELVTLTNHANQTNLEVIMIALRIACIAVLSQAKDLGEKKSVCFGSVIIAASLVEAVSCFSQGFSTSALVGIFAEVMLEVVCLFMIIAKYADKKERGSK